MKIVILLLLLRLLAACTDSDDGQPSGSAGVGLASDPVAGEITAEPQVGTFGDFFVVEGDILMTERELQEHNQQSASRRAEQPPSSELVVITVGGVPQYYPEGRRTLTYSYDVNSFSAAPAGAFDLTVQSLEAAMREWEDVCPECNIRFERVDGDVVEGEVWFIVRYAGPSSYIATAFFPHYHASRRYLTVFEPFTNSPYDPVGVMRHELGHTLGYLHEHIRDVPGCTKGDQEWKPITPYNPKSVMHYFCGGGGSLDLEIHESDRDGHSLLYHP